ncbi:MAG: hypothetical protein ACRDNL_01170, partial [Spirillospora sp.]
MRRQAQPPARAPEQTVQHRRRLVDAPAATGSFLLAGITVSAALRGPLLGAVLDRSPRPGRVLACALAGYAVALVVVLAALGRVPFAVPMTVAIGAGLLGPARWPGSIASPPPSHTGTRNPEPVTATLAAGSRAIVH